MDKSVSVENAVAHTATAIPSPSSELHLDSHGLAIVVSAMVDNRTLILDLLTEYNTRSVWDDSH
jgi:hypothetical protein